MDAANKDYDIAIVGTGPVGLIAALALSYLQNQQRGNQNNSHSIALIGPKPTPSQLAKDTRTTAFMQPSLTLLQNLGILAKVRQQAAPLRALRMIDDTGSLLRAPDCHFTAQEVGLPYFALNIPNQLLNTALLEEISRAPDVTWLETSAVTAIEQKANGLLFHLAERKNVTASFCIGADGRNSLSRIAASIETQDWSYDQTAIACAFTHSTPHHSTSIEIHRDTGPLTLIPLKEHHASLVWSLKPEEANRLVNAPEQDFIENLKQASLGFYGDINTIGKRVAFPIKGMKLSTLGQNRIALVGEAAHVVPPIGAQGLNMGLMDVACLIDAIMAQPSPGTAPQQIIEGYNNLRLSDVHRRTQSIDFLNKSLLQDQLPYQLLRSLGLNLLNTAPPLRRLLMTQGLGNPLTLNQTLKGKQPFPSLMQPPIPQEA